MQSIKKRTTISRNSRKYPRKRKESFRGKIWSKGAGEKNRSSLMCNSNDFLKEVFREIPVMEFDPLFSEKNYGFLYESAENYFRLLGKGFNVVYDPTDFRSLYDSLDEAVEIGHVSLIDKDGLLKFRIDHECYSQTLFYIPCEILSKVNGQFRDIILNFFRIFKFVHNLTSQNNSYHCEGLFQELEYQEELGLEGQDEMDSEYVALLRRYRDGDISIILNEINENPPYAPGELIEIIEKYIPQNEQEIKLITTIKKGLEEFFLSEDSIFNYVGTPDFDPETGCTPMDADELIMIIYSDDWICENMIESVNSSCEECDSEFFCSGSIELTPNTDILIEKNGFVEPFLKWVIELSTLLYEYK